MIKHIDLDTKSLRRLIQSKDIQIGANINLKIYGTLHCKSGKRMMAKNRVFFKTELEAKQHGFRPCGHCMRIEYLKWKNGLI